MAEATLLWDDTQPPILVESADDLFAHLERLGVIGGNARAWIITVEAHDSELTLGVGSSGSFVQFAAASGEPPYYVTLGDAQAVGYVDFYLHGAHHTEIPRRCLIPWPATERVVREFLETGDRSATVSWNEV